jgi:hypothetical protein
MTQIMTQICCLLFFTFHLILVSIEGLITGTPVPVQRTVPVFLKIVVKKIDD